MSQEVPSQPLYPQLTEKLDNITITLLGYGMDDRRGITMDIKLDTMPDKNENNGTKKRRESYTKIVFKYINENWNPLEERLNQPGSTSDPVLAQDINSFFTQLGAYSEKFRSGEGFEDPREALANYYDAVTKQTFHIMKGLNLQLEESRKGASPEIAKKSEYCYNYISLYNDLAKPVMELLTAQGINAKKGFLESSNEDLEKFQTQLKKYEELNGRLVKACSDFRIDPEEALVDIIEAFSELCAYLVGVASIMVPESAEKFEKDLEKLIANYMSSETQIVAEPAKVEPEETETQLELPRGMEAIDEYSVRIPGFSNTTLNNTVGDGIHLSIIKGVLTFSKLPSPVSIMKTMINGVSSVRYHVNGVEVFPTRITIKEAKERGFLPALSSNGGINFSGASMQSIGNISFGNFRVSGNDIHIGDVNMTSSPIENENADGVSNNITGDTRTIRLEHNQIKRYNEITGAEVNFEGQGTVEIDKITGSDVTIGTGITLNCNSIVGCSVIVERGGKIECKTSIGNTIRKY